MQNQEVFNIVRDSVADLCAVSSEQITGSTDLFSLGLDSILVIHLVVLLEKKFGLKIQIEDFYISPCINSVVEMIETRQQRNLV
jgi:acyl carrier protein